MMTRLSGVDSKSRGLTLLVVDDSAMMRAMIKRTALLTGLAIAEVHEAVNGREALELLHRHEIDALFTDVNMPVMTGIELLRVIGANERWQHMTRAIISTDGSTARKDEAFALGARFYVEKPFRPEAMRDVLCGLRYAPARSDWMRASLLPRAGAPEPGDATARSAPFHSLTEVRRALVLAATEVAENSLLAFAEPCDGVTCRAVAESVSRHPRWWLHAALDFRGPVDGRFELEVPRPAARRLGASFVGSRGARLGEADLSDFSGELANMICGTWLTRAWRHEVFRLAPPRVEDRRTRREDEGESLYDPVCLTIDGAPIRVGLHLDGAQPHIGR